MNGTVWSWASRKRVFCSANSRHEVTENRSYLSPRFASHLVRMGRAAEVTRTSPTPRSESVTASPGVRPVALVARREVGTRVLEERKEPLPFGQHSTGREVSWFRQRGELNRFGDVGREASERNGERRHDNSISDSAAGIGKAWRQRQQPKMGPGQPGRLPSPVR